LAQINLDKDCPAHDRQLNPNILGQKIRLPLKLHNWA
jgi:hypothetical protein